MKEIQLTNGGTTSVSDEDFEFLSRLKWFRDGQGKIRSSPISMHRLIMPGLAIIDHKDRNKSNNTRENLRLATHSQNNANRARYGKEKFKGIQTTTSRRFEARIKANKKLIHLGTYDTPEEAARAYDAAALNRFGEFACLNFPELKDQLQNA